MKIIDILVNIANNKEVPKRIKYEDKVYVYYEAYGGYYEEGNPGIYNKKFLAHRNEQYSAVLNTEVEITEEDKDIEEVEIVENIGNYYVVKDGKQCQLSKHDTVIIDKVNELVREVNKIKKDLK